jgi:hypothetical protein
MRLRPLGMRNTPHAHTPSMGHPQNIPVRDVAGWYHARRSGDGQIDAESLGQFTRNQVWRGTGAKRVRELAAQGEPDL